MACRHGVLALGDSITNGGGELQWGVALQSWALWVARGLGLPFTTYAVDGARAADVARRADPGLRGTHRGPGGALRRRLPVRGVNDVRAPDWEREAFDARPRAALAFLADPLRPRAGVHDPARPRAPAGGRAGGGRERAIEGGGRPRRARRSLRGLRRAQPGDGRPVHPTAFGQVELAERALDVLAADGMTVRVRPSTLIAYETTRWRRLRGDATYAYRQAKQGARIAAATALARTRG